MDWKLQAVMVSTHPYAGVILETEGSVRKMQKKGTFSLKKS